MAADDLSEVYGEKYYQGYYERSPQWFHFFNHVADCVIEQFQPKTHLDAGCAWGLLVEVMRERGVQSYGIDFSSYALDQVHPNVQPYCRRASLAEPIQDGPYDLITCIEVLEHMEEADALRAIANLTSAADVIVFSSTPYDFDDPTHINVRPLIYWLRAFARHGFYPPAESDAAFVAQHAFIVRKSAEPETDNALRMFAQVIELRAESRRLAARGSEAGWDQLETSPAWRMISQYRAWLESLREGRPGLFLAWERTARFAFSPLRDGRAPEKALSSANWDYDEWIARNEPSKAELKAQVGLANALPYRPRISVVMPVYKISGEILRAAIDSLKAQTYDHWELCASVIPSLNPDAAALLHSLSEKDSRIRVSVLDDNLGISENSNEALDLASGEFVALLDHDDTLAPFALYEVVSLINRDPTANFIYSDRDEISENGAKRSNPFFKPGWAPEILTSGNYLTHVCVMRTQHVRAVGGWNARTEGAQDWDLFIRVTRTYGGVRHIPKILYHWRHARSSVSTTGLAGKPFAIVGQVRTVQSLCREANLPQPVVFVGGKPKILWRMEDLPAVTLIVVPNPSGMDAVKRARLISRRTECVEAEVVCAALEAPVALGERVKFVETRADWSTEDLVSRLVGASTGEVLVFVDAGVEVKSEDWLRELVGPLMLPGVGLSGCHIAADATGIRRELGITFDGDGNASPVFGEFPAAGHLHGWQYWLRNWSAASGACFAVRRSTWDEIGGLSAPNSHSRPDVRLCLKLAERDLRVVTNPASVVTRSTRATLEATGHNGRDENRRIVRDLFPNGDPHLNPNLRLDDGIPVPR